MYERRRQCCPRVSEDAERVEQEPLIAEQPVDVRDRALRGARLCIVRRLDHEAQDSRLLDQIPDGQENLEVGAVRVSLDEIDVSKTLLSSEVSERQLRAR